MNTKLKEVEKLYYEKVINAFENGVNLTATWWVEFSATLFNEIKIGNISDSNNDDSDMILYQYGVYNWGNEFGRHFSFDMTRQFIDPSDDEPFQLCFTLIYDPEPFEELKSHDCWSGEFPSLENYIHHIKSTDGFKLANKFTPKTYLIRFEQC